MTDDLLVDAINYCREHMSAASYTAFLITHVKPYYYRINDTLTWKYLPRSWEAYEVPAAILRKAAIVAALEESWR